jgi:hypothetical protein
MEGVHEAAAQTTSEFRQILDPILARARHREMLSKQAARERSAGALAEDTDQATARTRGSETEVTTSRALYPRSRQFVKRSSSFLYPTNIRGGQAEPGASSHSV